MEFISEKVWTLGAAIISALGGFVIYERNRVENRLIKIEQEMSEQKTDLAVVKESLMNLKEDTQEIKEGQKALLDLLNRRKKY